MLKRAGISLMCFGFAGALLVVGCSNDTEKPEEEFAPPTSLKVASVGVTTATVEWGKSSDEGLGNFLG